MRIWLALVILALAPATAHAQAGAMGSGQQGGYRQPMSERHKDPDKRALPPVKADDKAYRDALKRLPDKPYDPWQGTR